MTNISKIVASRAKRQMLVLAMQIVGPSGSGKTLGGLIFAYGMMKAKYPDLSEYDVWGKIGLVDTEHDRSLIYEGMEYGDVKIGEFIHVPLSAPYTYERYDASVKALADCGVEVCIVDSASHAWEGDGGVLDYQQQKGGNFQAWGQANKDAYNPLVSLLVGEKYRMHMISTARAKQEYAMQRNEHTEKLEIAKLGLKPVQRDTLEYEMQLVFRIDMENHFEMSKDNSSLFRGKREIMNMDHGRLVYEWLEKGVDIYAEKREAEAKAEAERQELVKTINDLAKKHELLEWVAAMEKHPSVGPANTATLVVLQRFKGALDDKIVERQKIKDAQAAKELAEQQADGEQLVVEGK